ncbi:hypothetical protein [Microbacterium suwonense]|uniref:Uncharacterized protein n=1 Tax=Microbacterium suwonense TaxID=683047 RepID=A0ABM8FUH4_9MICO|nr:hypothetical protein [Microbacterium suwonense]BDZ39342.1 hypothetical protein GCM10025863_19560 [Microbacterium suwonense]
MCPTGDEQEASEPNLRQSWRQAHPEAAAEGRRRYREAHAEERAAAHRAWRERNIERSRELNRESAKRQAHRRRQRLKKNAHAREWYAENREVALERGRRFREEHPDKVREYQRRYKDGHPERARRSGREYAQRHRDANADAIRERQREAAAARRKRNPNQHREWYEKNLEEQRARGREDQRRRRRLKALGLPPSRIHRLYAEERRAHDAAADEYFARRRSVAERGAIAAEAVDGFGLDVPKAVAIRRRVVLRDQVMPLERDPSAWRVSGDVPPEVIRWRRARDLQALKESHDRLVDKIRAERPQIYEHHRQRNEARLREEIRLDSIARELRGLPPYEVEQEVKSRLDDEVTRIVNQRLNAMRHRIVTRAEDIAKRRNTGWDAASPHQVAATGPDMGSWLR